MGKHSRFALRVCGGVLLLGVGIFLGFLIGSSGTERSDSAPKVREDGAPRAQEEPEADGAVASGDLAVGDTADVDGIQVTLQEAFRTDGDELDRDRLPEGPYTHVVTRFRIQNGSEEELNIRFQAYSDTGTDLNQAFLIRQHHPSAPREDRGLVLHRIRAGADVTGTLAFVAREDEVVYVEFFRNFMKDPNATWDLGLVSDLPERPFDS